MSAMVREDPTKKVLCFSLSSTFFDTFATIYFALAVWYSCTYDN